MSLRKSIPLAFLLAAFVAGSVSAAKLPSVKVPEDYATIQDAIDAVCAGGGKITVAPGDYLENPMIISCHDVSLYGKAKKNQQAVIIGCGGDPTVKIQQSSSITIKGFGITMGDPNGVEITNSSNVLVSRNEIYDNNGDGVTANSGSTNVEVSDNEIRGSVKDVGDCTGRGHGVRSDSPGIGIEKNDIHDNDCNGVRTVGGGNRIERNTIYGNDLHGIASNTNAMIVKNTITGNADDGVRAGAGDVLSKNVITGNGGDGVEVRDKLVVLVDNRISDNGANGVLGWTEIISMVPFPRAPNLSVIKNRVEDNALSGLDADLNKNVVADNNRIMGNLTGIQGIGPSSVVQRNQSSRNLQDGIVIDDGTNGSVFYRNKADLNSDDGFDMSTLALGNSIERNSARRNGDLDFQGLSTADPTNTFENNKFGTSN